jgi:hypothetical protein
MNDHGLGASGPGLSLLAGLAFGNQRRLERLDPVGKMLVVIGTDPIQPQSQATVMSSRSG